MREEIYCFNNKLYDEYTTYCQLHSVHKLPQTVVMPRIAEVSCVTKKRTNKGYRYEGVGIAKPEALEQVESLKILEKFREQREPQCREDKCILNLMDEIFH